MTPEVMAEYLVRLSADVDNGSFNSAMTAINQLTDKLKQIKGFAAATALGAAFSKIGAAAVDAVKDVARADLEFAKLGQRMWITKDSAKALSVAMKTMGCTEEDIAWVPELREQFFRLKNEMDELSTPADAEDGLKYVRSISYEIESLQVKFKMLKEWIVYYLIKIIRPFMDEFKEWVQWLNGKLKGRMPDIAKNIAKWLGFIVSLASTAMKAIRKIGESIYNFFEEMPESAKKWGAILAGVGAFVLASPLGKLITVLGGALMLLEDFMYYANGWNSSKALAPVWKTILEFLESDTLKETKKTVLELLGKAGDRLNVISRYVGEIMSDLFDGIDWKGILEEAKKSLGEIYDGIVNIGTELDKVFDSLEKHTNERAAARQKSFWGKVGEGISDALISLFKFGGALGDILSALSCLVNRDWEGASAYAKSALLNIGSASATLAKNSVLGWSMGIGDSVAKFAMENYTEGDQWMGTVTDNPNIQCDSFTGDLYSRTGIMPHKKGQITTAEDWGDAYHHAGDGYELQPGDYIDGEGHVGVYLGNGMYRARNSSGGIHTGTMEEWNELFGAPIGYGSVAEYVKNTQPEKYEAFEKQRQAGYTPKSNTPIAESSKKWQLDYSGGRSSGGDFLNWGQNAAANMSMAKTSAYTPTASSVSRNTTFGDIIVNVAGTNATAGEIGNAVWDKINARMNRGVTV